MILRGILNEDESFGEFRVPYDHATIDDRYDAFWALKDHEELEIDIEFPLKTFPFCRFQLCVEVDGMLVSFGEWER